METIHNTQSRGTRGPDNPQWRGAERREPPKKEYVGPQPSAAQVEPGSEGFRFSFGDIWRALQAEGKVPSWTRIIVTTAIALGVALGAAYVSDAVMVSFMVGASTLTASSFLIMAAGFLGTLLVIAAAVWGITKIFSWSFSGKVDDVVSGARNKVFWAFTPDPKPQRA